MPTLLRRIFSRKTAIRLALTVACLIVLIFALRAYENRRGAQAWAAYRTDAEQRGVRLWLSDFVPPPVPDSENFAAIPIIQEIFAAAEERREFHSVLALPPRTQGGWPPLAEPLKSRRIDLVQWRETLTQTTPLSANGEDSAREVLAALADYEPALQQLRDAARRPRSRFPVKWEEGIAAMLPHFGTLRDASRIFALRMAAHLALGDSAAAYADWRDGLALYRALDHEPLLICGLTRIAILVQMENALWDGLAGRQWAETELHAIESDLASLNLLDDCKFALASERGENNSRLDEIARYSTRQFVEFFAPGCLHGSHAGPRDYVAAVLVPRGWFRQGQVRSNERYDRHLARIDSASGGVAPSSKTDDAGEMLRPNGPFGSLPYMFATVVMPGLIWVENNYAATHTTTQQTRTACALELFRRARGAFPKRLAELVPEFLDAIPRDVMDGAPLRYRRTTDGKFELWSIGANRKDDNVKSDPAKSLRDQPDWVWRP